MMEMFKNPPQIYRGTDFWMLNDELRDDEIRRQVKDFHEKGMGGFIARTYVGLRTDYPGPKWKHQIRVMLEEATKYGMRVTLQAMRMPGGVAETPIEDVLDVIQCVSKEFYDSKAFTEKNYLCEILEEVDGNYIVKRKSAAKPDEITGEWRGGTLNMFSPELCKKYVKLCYEDMWEEFREYYGNTIHTMWVDEPLVNVRCIPYPDGIEKIFFDRWGYNIKEHLSSLFFDIGDYKKIRYQYRVLLQKLMEEGYFKTLSAWCKENNIKFSGHLFHEDALVTQIFGGIATMPYYKYLDIPGIDTLEADMPWRYGKIKPPYSREYIGYAEKDGSECPPNGFYAAPMATIGMYTTPLQLTSAAHQAGKEHMLCEMFGVTSHNFTLRDQRHLFDHFASLGINHKCIHAFFYNLHGKAKRSYPHQVNYYQPYWERYSDMFDYFRRTSWFISQGKPIKDTVVIHPLDTAYMLVDPAIDNVQRENAVLRDYERFYYAIVRGLCAAQCQFEFGDEATIGDFGEITEDGFKIGEMTYKTVVLPYLQVIRKSTFNLICEYAKRGGKVYILGTMPDRLDGEENATLCKALIDAGCEFVEYRKDLIDILVSQNSSYTLSCTSDATPIIVNHRADQNRDYYFIMNDDCSDEKEITLTIKGKKKATFYNALEATAKEYPTIYENGNTYLNVTIPEGSSIMFTLEDTPELKLPEEESSYLVRNISDKWEISRHNPNVLLLENCSFKKKENEEYSAKCYPSINICAKLNEEKYQGDVYLRYTFKSNIDTKVQLALEDLDITEGWFNGIPIDITNKGYYFSRAFEVVDLPANCIIGENEIVLKRAFVPAITAGGLTNNQERVDLESIYVIGDFGVFSREEPVTNETRRFSRFFTIDTEKCEAGKDITGVGYPFYTGAMSFTKTVTISEEELKNDKIMFTYEEFNGCTLEMIVNGQSLGFKYWAPYEIDIKPALKVGENIITVKIANCLRNLLGPYHRVQGELGHNWARKGSSGSIYSTTAANPWDGNPYDKQWLERMEIDDTRWTPDYYSLPFGLGKVKLKFYK